MAKKKVTTKSQAAIQTALLQVFQRISDLLGSERFEWEVFGKGEDGLYALLGLENVDQLVSILIRSGWYALQANNKRVFKLGPYHARTGNRFPIRRQQRGDEKPLVLTLGNAAFKSKTLPSAVGNRKWKGIVAKFKDVGDVTAAIASASESNLGSEANETRQNPQGASNRQRTRHDTPSSKTPSAKMKRRNMQPTPSPMVRYRLSQHQGPNDMEWMSPSRNASTSRSDNANSRDEFESEANVPRNPPRRIVSFAEDESPRRMESSPTLTSLPEDHSMSFIGASNMSLLLQPGQQGEQPSLSQNSTATTVSMTPSPPIGFPFAASFGDTTMTSQQGETLQSMLNQHPSYPTVSTNAATVLTTSSADISPIEFPQEHATSFVQVNAVPVIKRTRNAPPQTIISEVEANGITLCVKTRKGFKPVYHRQEETKTIPETHAIIAIPSRKELVDVTQNEVHLKSHNSLKKFNKVKRRDNFSFGIDGFDYGRRLLGGLVACTPKVSSLSHELIAPITLHAFFQHCGLELSCEDAINISPSREHYENLLVEFALDSLLIITETINRVGVIGFSFDKADSEKPGTFGGCTKLAACFDRTQTSEQYPDGKVIVFPIDADKTGGTSEAVAAGVKYSVDKLALGTHVVGRAITVDSGGGGTGNSVENPLKRDEVIEEHALRGNCTIHNINLEIKAGIEKALILNGKGEEARNFLQLLYTAFAWEKEVGPDDMREYWESTVEFCLVGESEDTTITALMMDVVDLLESNIDSIIKFRVMSKGSATRWWSIGEAADTLLKTMKVRTIVAMKVIDSYENKTKAPKIAEDFISRVQEPSLICDTALVKCYHRYYLARHLKWLQLPDKLTRMSAFQSFNIFVRSFLMRQDYEEMRTNWRNIPEFSDLVKYLDEVSADEKPTQIKKIELFLEVAQKEHEKMFHMWVSDAENAFLAGFAEAETARLICQRLLGYPLCYDPSKTEYDEATEKWINPDQTDTDMSIDDEMDEGNRMFDSDVHGRVVDLEKLAIFIADQISPRPEDEWHYHVTKNKDLFDKIAHGYNIWNREDEATLEDRLFALEQYGGVFFSQNQGTERANKDQNLAASNGRKEKNVSMRMAAMSMLKEVSSASIIGEKRSNFRGKKKIQETFDRIREVHRRMSDMRRRVGSNRMRKRRKKLRKNYKKTFQAVRSKEAKTKFEASLPDEHIPSAKEQIRGIDIACIIQRKVQFGLLFNKGNNLTLLRTEWKGRYKKQLDPQRDLTQDEIKQIDAMKIKALKNVIKQDELERDGDDNGFDARFFAPQYTNHVDYTWELVKSK